MCLTSHHRAIAPKAIGLHPVPPPVLKRRSANAAAGRLRCGPGAAAVWPVWRGRRVWLRIFKRGGDAAAVLRVAGPILPAAGHQLRIHELRQPAIQPHRCLPSTLVLCGSCVLSHSDPELHTGALSRLNGLVDKGHVPMRRALATRRPAELEPDQQPGRGPPLPEERRCPIDRPAACAYCEALWALST